MKCPLCGKEFEFSREVCSNCPLHAGGCDLIKCPNCGYEFPKGSKLVDFFAKLFKPRRKRK
ncbi:hypothetical protein A2625_04775 [candidate division WOR-1 bacterium RIFCSPHIGHO2_01_FULL_53_15]|uniref:Uncharacterized protein n=1 Tax=candidate division WOR-1 bacterium RIFCSPHIGHO2_01_FULL_53_15 TaxID=1802564 RepID=A0A1F4Q2D9_UNCSA|nr:MAG: hypothetical protein A2625_04775 [candidate division WOR-1 bacterium RIFCSPHIGHO2_01_FULL_53_15]OGC13194.1 MAG: hypothetical protein A3D23_01030 [candidate division WOR-1 bacterium RIFCSPHIGHO2_02_FULL_53_26]